MKFVGMNAEEKKMVLEALEFVWRAKRECLESCKPRPDMKDASPRIIAAYERDVALAEKLYAEAESAVTEHACAHPGCVGKRDEVVCSECRD